MILYFIFALLAAIGAIFLLWIVAVAFLPATRPGTAYIRCQRDDLYAVLRRYRWLRDLGLTRFDLAVMDSDLEESVKRSIRETYPGVFFISTEAIQTEGSDFSGRTGTSDPAGNHRRGGISEL